MFQIGPSGFIYKLSAEKQRHLCHLIHLFFPWKKLKAVCTFCLLLFKKKQNIHHGGVGKKGRMQSKSKRKSQQRSRLFSAVDVCQRSLFHGKTRPWAEHFHIKFFFYMYRAFIDIVIWRFSLAQGCPLQEKSSEDKKEQVEGQATQRTTSCCRNTAAKL